MSISQELKPDGGYGQISHALISWKLPRNEKRRSALQANTTADSKSLFALLWSVTSFMTTLIRFGS